MDGEDPLVAAERLIGEAELVALGDGIDDAVSVYADAAWLLYDQDLPPERADDVFDLVTRILEREGPENDEEWAETRRAAEWVSRWARDVLGDRATTRAAALAKAGQATMAETALREAIAVGYDWDEWWLLGFLLVHLPGRRAEGIDALERALRSPSPDVVACAAYELGLARVLNGDFAGARRLIALSLEQDVAATEKGAGRVMTALDPWWEPAFLRRLLVWSQRRRTRIWARRLTRGER
jgi:tetratricopeptide (TPR) repeat protein